MTEDVFVTMAVCAGSIATSPKGVEGALDSSGTLSDAQFESGAVSLFARVFRPANQHPPAILLLHGFPGTELNFDVAHALRRLGFLVIVPHYRGSWGMPGTFSWSNVIADARACAEWIDSTTFRNQYGGADLVAIAGHSLGGFAALQIGHLNPTLKVVSIAGFDFGAFAEHERHNADAVETIGRAWESSTMPLHGTSGRALAREALSCPDSWKLRSLGAKYVGREVLLIGAAQDDVAPLSLHHQPLVAAFTDANANVTQKTFDTDHSFASARVRLCAAVCDWLN